MFSYLLLSLLFLAHTSQQVDLTPDKIKESNLVKTIDLDLGYSQLSSIACNSFDQLGNVTRLTLKHNELRTIGNRTFSSLDNLTRLDLSFNEISEIEPLAFADLYNLEELNLEFNELRELNETTFWGLPNLTRLILMNNPIEKIHPRTFEKLTRLNLLDLNQIENITLDLFRQLKSQPSLENILISKHVEYTIFETDDSWEIDNEISRNYIQIKKIDPTKRNQKSEEEKQNEESYIQSRDSISEIHSDIFTPNNASTVSHTKLVRKSSRLSWITFLLVSVGLVCVTSLVVVVYRSKAYTKNEYNQLNHAQVDI